tara:strand:- start:486 stop:719 length:234 start_codon:yes stop_codon:yes gene_type:complete
MVEQQDITDLQVNIMPEDVQAAMQASPLVALQVQNRALTRKIRELYAELAKVKAAYVELVIPEPEVIKEASNASSGG